jgi:predicted hydrocarbon binding protein
LESTTRIGKPQDLFEGQVNQMVCKRALPEVVAFLYKRRGDRAKEDLRDIARVITQRLLQVWTPKSNQPFKVIKEMMDLFFGNKKIKGKVLERVNGKKPTKIAIRDYNCPICPDRKGGEEVEIKGIHYCVAVSGSIEALLKYLVANKIVSCTDAKCETVKSTGSGDEYCEHILTLEYGTEV